VPTPAIRKCKTKSVRQAEKNGSNSNSKCGG